MKENNKLPSVPDYAKPSNPIEPEQQGKECKGLPEFDSPKNWVEDYDGGDNQYICTCIGCKEQFYGYKRRVICKECYAEPEGVKEVWKDIKPNTFGTPFSLVDGKVIPLQKAYEDLLDKLSNINKMIEEKDKKILELEIIIDGLEN